MQLLGSATSSPQATSRPGSLTSDPLSISSHRSWLATRIATSSPASADGPTPCASQAGPSIDLFGQALAPASRSAKPAVARGMKTSATYGRHGRGSSASADLSWSLVSRLQTATASLGSTLFVLSWKTLATPSQRLISRLLASVPRKSGNVCSSWPTPNARDHKHGSQQTYRERGGGPKGDSLSNLARSVLPGPTSSGSPAETVKRAQLNPAFSRWLQGYPATWDACAPTATRSSLKRLPHSSAVS